MASNSPAPYVLYRVRIQRVRRARTRRLLVDFPADPVARKQDGWCLVEKRPVRDGNDIGMHADERPASEGRAMSWTTESSIDVEPTKTSRAPSMEKACGRAARLKNAGAGRA